MPRRAPSKVGPPKKKRRGRPPARESEKAREALPAGRIIKRYGNRRLYDLQRSRCVTLHEIAEMVRAGEEVRVLSVDTDEEITKRILTQILLETQNRDQLELLPVELLRKIIALRDAALTGWLQQYLATGVKWLERQMAAGPGAKATQEALGGFSSWLKQPPGAPPSASGPHPEDLRNQVDQLQRRLDELTSKMPRR